MQPVADCPDFQKAAHRAGAVPEFLGVTVKTRSPPAFFNEGAESHRRASRRLDRPGTDLSQDNVMEPLDLKRLRETPAAGGSQRNGAKPSLNEPLARLGDLVREAERRMSSTDPSIELRKRANPSGE
jgi:hypothetical protein